MICDNFEVRKRGGELPSFKKGLRKLLGELHPGRPGLRVRQNFLEWDKAMAPVSAHQHALHPAFGAEKAVEERACLRMMPSPFFPRTSLLARSWPYCYLEGVRLDEANLHMISWAPARPLKRASGPADPPP